MINVRRNILIMEMQVEMQGCSRCKKTLSINEFPIKKNGKGHKKTCSVCEEKTKRKETMNDDRGKEEEVNKNNEKKKIRSYQPPPRVCYHILKEQKFECRGPGKNECNSYQCPLKVANIKFSDDKSPDPEIDHILPVSEGGNNDLENFQALCGCCHNKKTTLEGLIKSNGGIRDKLVVDTYKYLTIPKYQNKGEGDGDQGFAKVTFTDSDSDSDYDDIFEYRKKLMN